MATVDVIGKIEGSVQDGGWTATGAVFNDADRLDFYQEIEAWFDLYAGSGWGAQPRRGFRGHLMPETWQKVFLSSEAPFSAFTAQEYMKRGEIQGIYYRNVAGSPANRHQIINMSLAKIVYEIVGGHCNLMHASEAANYDSSLWSGSFTTTTSDEGFMYLDIDDANSTDLDEYEVKQGNFWSRLQEIAGIEFYLLYVDKFNVLHYVPHPMFDATLPDAVLTITSDLLLEPLTIERRNTEAVGQVKLQGTTPSGLQISGKYPSNPTAGPIVYRSGYLATANTLMNTIAERMYKSETRDYRITAVLPGGIGLLLDLMDRVSMTYTSSGDGITWSAKKFWIDSISVELLAGHTARTTLVMDAEN